MAINRHPTTKKISPRDRTIRVVGVPKIKPDVQLYVKALIELAREELDAEERARK